MFENLSFDLMRPYCDEDAVPFHMLMNTNVTNLDDGRKLDIMIPGFTKDEVNIEMLDERTIKIHAEKKESSEIKGRQEYKLETCERIFAFPEKIDSEAVTAKLENGILTLEVHFDQKAVESKRILIG